MRAYPTEDVIGGFYTTNRRRRHDRKRTADDDLDEIDPGSVRTSDFTLLTRAGAHPGG